MKAATSGVKETENLLNKHSMLGELKRAGKSENLVKKTPRLFFKLDLNIKTTFPVTRKELTSPVRFLQKKIILKVLTKYLLYGQMTLNDSGENTL